MAQRFKNIVCAEIYRIGDDSFMELSVGMNARLNVESFRNKGRNQLI